MNIFDELLVADAAVAVVLKLLFPVVAFSVDDVDEEEAAPGATTTVPESALLIESFSLRFDIIILDGVNCVICMTSLTAALSLLRSILSSTPTTTTQIRSDVSFVTTEIDTHRYTWR